MKIQTFSNSVSDFIFIKKEKNEPLEYQITDINGRKITSGKLINTTNNISFTKMNQGIYFIKITNPKTQEHIIDKVIKWGDVNKKKQPLTQLLFYRNNHIIREALGLLKPFGAVYILALTNLAPL